MDLQTLRKRARSLIREPRQNIVLDDELTDWANDASYEATKDINYPWKFQTIYGVADQADYNLASDFFDIHPLLDFMFNKQKLDKHSVQWMEKEYPDYLKANSVTQPEEFYFKAADQVSIYPPPALVASGTDTTGSGTTTLNDSAASFISDYVGHAIQNTTDGSEGLVTSVASGTQLVCTLANGTNNTWTIGDAYTINLSGSLPYVYKEADMVDDDDESLLAAKFPYLILYRIMPLAEIKMYRVSSSQKEQNRAVRWETLYATELVKAKSTINKLLRGQRDRTVGPGEW